jgi:hypothetical protein
LVWNGDPVNAYFPLLNPEFSYEGILRKKEINQIVQPVILEKSS